MELLVFGGALRSGSFNKKFAHAAHLSAQKAGAKTIFISLKDFDIPVYDGDEEAAHGIPAGVHKLGEMVKKADGIILSTPEYNGSIPGVLKNVIDWLSRIKPQPLEHKKLLLLAASPGALGGVRSLWHSRQPFEVLGVHVYPEMFGLPKANEAFAADGALVDSKNQERLDKLVSNFIQFLSQKNEK